MVSRKLIPAGLAAAALSGLVSAPAFAPASAAVGGHQAFLHHSSGVQGLHPLKFNQQASLNWAGYVASSGGYNHVSAQWHVPTVTTTADDRYSSTWIGIGGDGTPDLIQAGTEQDSISGNPNYVAWTEILPEAEAPANMTVAAGDLMSVDISQIVPYVFTISMSDLTNGQSYSRITPYPSLMTTAEWIHEATTINGGIANLTKTSNAVFDFGFANGQSIKNAGGVDTIIMQDNSGHTIATPGPLDSDGDGFQVADGSSAPPAPAS